MYSTLSQTSPLEPDPPAQGVFYDNYPGFWQALSNLIVCPVKVDDLSAREKSGKVQLSWSHVEADQYNVYRKAEGGEYEFITATTTTYCTYLDTNVVNGTTYYYMVTKMVGGVEECKSDVAGATPTSRIIRR